MNNGIYESYLHCVPASTYVEDNRFLTGVTLDLDLIMREPPRSLKSLSPNSWPQPGKTQRATLLRVERHMGSLATAPAS